MYRFLYLFFIIISNSYQVQFSWSQAGQPAIVPCGILRRPHDSETHYAYRASYTCSGIRHCKYAYPDIKNTTCDAYNRVNLADINNLYKKGGKINDNDEEVVDIEEKLKALTRSYVYGSLILDI